MITSGTYSIVLTFVIFSCFSQVFSQSSQILTYHYRMYNSLKFPGQVVENGIVITKLSCAIRCLSNVNCLGFRYNKSCESVIDSTNVTTLNFTDADNVIRKRQIFLTNMEYIATNLTTYRLEKLLLKISVGDFIYLRGKLLKDGDVRISLADQLDFINVAYQFRARCNNALCLTKYVTINNKYSGTWNNTYYGNISAYTLVVNKTFEFHMLVTSGGLVTYLNNVYLYTHSTGMSIGDVNYIELNANVQVEEFSL